MQYLVLKNRIINLAYRDVEINQPLPRSTDKRHRVTASDPERKISHALFQGTLDECQRFIEALGRALNFHAASRTDLKLFSNLCTPATMRTPTKGPPHDQQRTS